MANNSISIVAASIGFAGVIIAQFLGAFLQRRSAQQAAQRLIDTAEVVDSRLQHIANLSGKTHEIVNSQHTAMLHLIARLTRQIADSNPDDLAAEQTARDAEQDALQAQSRQNHFA